MAEYPPASILIADDHSIIRKTLREWLMKKYPWVIILEASSGEEIISMIDAVAMDLILTLVSGN